MILLAWIFFLLDSLQFFQFFWVLLAMPARAGVPLFLQTIK
jgi:hypothetical protein